MQPLCDYQIDLMGPIRVHQSISHVERSLTVPRFRLWIVLWSIIFHALAVLKRVHKQTSLDSEHSNEKNRFHNSLLDH